MAKIQLPSGKRQKGRDGDKRREGEPLCLMGPGYAKSGLHRPQVLGRRFSRGWVYEKEYVRGVTNVRVEASYHFKGRWRVTEIEHPGMWNLGKEGRRNTEPALFRAAATWKHKKRLWGLENWYVFLKGSWKAPCACRAEQPQGFQRV